MKGSGEGQGKAFAITEEQLDGLTTIKQKMDSLLAQIEALARMGQETAHSGERLEIEFTAHWPDVFMLLLDLVKKGDDISEQMDEALRSVEFKSERENTAG